MKEGVCKLCGERKRLVKSHSIPRRFFKGIKGGAQHAVFYDGSITAKREATYLQAGIYDDDSLCEGCEAKFSEWDRYGGEILDSPCLDHPLPEFDNRAYSVNCDTDKLRRFILSVTWRASISRNPFYSYVNLGPYEDKIKDRIFDPTPLDPDEFPIVISHFNQADFGVDSQMLFPPLRERRQDGLNIRVLYLMNLKILIHIDKRASAYTVGPFVIRQPEHFLMLELPTKLMREQEFVSAMMRRRQAMRVLTDLG
jgi:hypothetical protein